MRLCQLSRSWMSLYYYLQILPGVYVNVLLLLLSLVLRHQHSDIEHCLLLVFLSFSPSSHSPLTLFPSTHSLLPEVHFTTNTTYCASHRPAMASSSSQQNRKASSSVDSSLPHSHDSSSFVTTTTERTEVIINVYDLLPVHTSPSPLPTTHNERKKKGQTNPFHLPPNSPADSPPSSGPSAVPSSTRA